MENTNDDMMLEDLFRQKLEDGEVSPSLQAGKSLMRKVGIREFLRFSPSRLNIWYTGAVAVSGTLLTIFLSDGSESTSQSFSEPLRIEQSVKQPGDSIRMTAGQPIVTKDTEMEGSGERRQSGSSRRSGSAGKVNSDYLVKEAIVVPEAGNIKVNSLSLTELSGDSPGNRNKLIVKSGSASYISASALEGCSPLRISFRCVAVPFDSCRWDFGDGGSSRGRNPVWLFDNAGTYTVELLVFSSGTQSVSTVTINVYPKPQARFEISTGDGVMAQSGITFHNYSAGAEKYKWDFGDGTGSELFEPRHNYKKSDSYDVRLIAISEFGCSDSLIIYNTLPESGCEIEFPNAFIPNINGPSGGYYSMKSDETSEIFHPVASGVADYQLRIFSKGGMMLFESNDINFGWDGYYKGQLCDPGVYIWKVRGEFLSGDQFTRMGDLTLLKN